MFVNISLIGGTLEIFKLRPLLIFLRIYLMTKITLTFFSRFQSYTFEIPRFVSPQGRSVCSSCSCCVSQTARIHKTYAYTRTFWELIIFRILIFLTPPHPNNFLTPKPPPFWDLRTTLFTLNIFWGKNFPLPQKMEREPELVKESVAVKPLCVLRFPQPVRSLSFFSYSSMFLFFLARVRRPTVEPFLSKNYRDFEASSLGILVLRGTCRSI